jgi:hypothetical protein
VVFLPLSERARIVSSGNDLLLMLGGWRPDGKTPDKRPVLRYGSNWRYRGFSCASKATGVECRRGEHGFRLSSETMRLY